MSVVMRIIAKTLTIISVLSDTFTFGQNHINGYNRNEAKCMTLLSERSNIVILNDTNLIDYHFNGYKRDQLILKGDSTVNVIRKPKMWGAKIVPSKDTFDLHIYTNETDLLLFTERFIAISKDSVKSIKNSLFLKTNYCDYIFSVNP
ncbi:MAG: hypothetical protein ACJA0U_002902 [Salibacteraceae bacterium]|jgi:hypothetical protein